MASLLAPKRKNEYASALAASTKVTEAALMAHDLNRLKAIWDVVKPKKRVSLLPSNWKTKDLEGLKEIYSGTVVPHMELPDDKRWSRWGKAKSILEISTWEDQVKESSDPRSSHDPVQSPESRRILRMFEVSSVPNYIATQLQWASNWKVQKELVAKKEASHMTSEKSKGMEEYPLFRPRGRTRKADEKPTETKATSSDGSWMRMGGMESHDISSGDEAKFNVNLTKEEMDEIMMRRKGKGDGKKDLKQEAGAEVKK